MTLRTPLVLSAAALLAVATVTGCSSSTTTGTSSSPAASASPADTTPNNIEDKSAEQILKAAQTAAGEASSVHVVVEQDSNGTTVRTDITLSENGSTGTLGQPDGQGVEVIGTPDAIYVKGGAFAQQLGAPADQVEGKWISIPKDNPVSQSFAGLGSVQDFVKNVLATPKGLKKLPVKDVGGVPAVGLDSAQGALWISTQGEPLPLEVTAPEGQSGKMTLSDWNAPVTITPPPQDEVVDITSLQSAAPTAPAPSPAAS